MVELILVDSKDVATDTNYPLGSYPISSYTINEVTWIEPR
jgi:hypothetical protein